MKIQTVNLHGANLQRTLINKRYFPDAGNASNGLSTIHWFQSQIGRCGGIQRDPAASRIENELKRIGKGLELCRHNHHATGYLQKRSFGQPLSR